MQIALALFYSGDMEQSITYSKKVIPMALLAGNKRLLVIFNQSNCHSIRADQYARFRFDLCTTGGELCL